MEHITEIPRNKWRFTSLEDAISCERKNVLLAQNVAIAQNERWAKFNLKFQYLVCSKHLENLLH